MAGRVTIALAAVLAMPLAAQVPEAPASVTGAVVRIAEQEVVLDTKTGPVTVAMTPGWTVGAAHPGTPAEIKPGDFIASANTNLDAGSGRANEVRVFEPGYEPEHGTHPIGTPNVSMTHGTVARSDPDGSGWRLEVTYPGGSRRILVPADMKITAYTLRDRAAAAPGTAVTAVTRKGKDGVPRAGRLLLTQP